MTKIFIDTNMFADFYQSGNPKSPLDYLDQIIFQKDDLVLVSHTLDEYRRNRGNWIKALIAKIPNPGINLPKSVLVADRKEFKTIHDLQEQQDQKLRELKTHLEKLLANENEDPLAVKIKSLFTDSSISQFKIDKSIIALGHERKLLGNPPNSKDKHTIGDEVIWETLLKYMKDDLIMVTYDNEFSLHENILKEEFREKTGKILLSVKKNLSDALKELKKPLPDRLVEIEKASTTDSFGNPVSPVSNLKRWRDKYATDPQCSSCGAYGPWNGMMCLNCGRWSDE